MISRFPHAGDAHGATPGHPLLIPALSQSLALSMSRQQALLSSVGIGQHPRWSPAQLFAAGEQGAWYDPSDLSTLFQDRAGTTPVTADGQTAGLMLDKSKGLVLGAEKVTNGDFNGGTTTGWVPTGATISVVGGQAELVSTVNGTFQVNQQLAVTAGRFYSFSATLRRGTCPQPVYIGFNGGAAVISTNNTTDTVLTAIIAANMTPQNVQIYTTGANIGNTLYFDNISVKELPGNHAVAPSNAARPLKTSTSAADWINYDAVDDVLNSTFPSSLGSSCTICRANVGAAPTILTAQTVGTSYADSTDHAGLIIINRALTGQETTNVTAWLTANGATA